MGERLLTLQQQLDEKEQELQQLREEISENIFEHTSDFMELEELYIVKRWLERLEVRAVGMWMVSSSETYYPWQKVFSDHDIAKDYYDKTV